jgi:hypothetical protein
LRKAAGQRLARRYMTLALSPPVTSGCPVSLAEFCGRRGNNRITPAPCWLAWIRKLQLNRIYIEYRYDDRLVLVPRYAVIVRRHRSLQDVRIGGASP